MVEGFGGWLGDRPETLDYPRLTAVAVTVAALAAAWSAPPSLRAVGEQR